MNDPLAGLDAIEWHDHGDAYGAADEVPNLLRLASAGDSDAWFDLWGTVWHQGTVYDATALAVPFVVRLAVRPEGDEPSRAQAAFLLASIAAATSFVLPAAPKVMLQAAWLREAGEQVPARDLAEECKAAVAADASSLAGALDDAPLAVRAGLLAALGAVGSTLPEPVRKALAPLKSDSDARLKTVATLALALASGSLTSELVQEGALVDEEAGEFLEAISDWPEPVRAVELIRELCERLADE